MSINLSSEDMLHICQLLREDAICSQHVLNEEPDNLDAARSLGLTQDILLKVAAIAILKGYTIKDDPHYVSTRRGLN